MKLYLLFVIVIGCALARKPPSDNNSNNNNSNDSSDDSSDDSTSYSEGDSCGICGDGTSTYVESISGDARIITGTGCPHHYSVCTGKGVLDHCGGTGEEGSKTVNTKSQPTLSCVRTLTALHVQWELSVLP